LACWALGLSVWAALGLDTCLFGCVAQTSPAKKRWYS
jgi:hypothetical protein